MEKFRRTTTQLRIISVSISPLTRMDLMASHLDAPLDTDAFISQNADRPLCQEQTDLVKLILGGMNVFYTAISRLRQIGGTEMLPEMSLPDG